METVVKKPNRILKQAFPRPDKVLLEDDKGIIGRVVSDRFKGLDSMERLKMIWDVLDRHLTAEERRRIVIILAITPTEELAHSASAAPYLNH